MPLLLSNCAPLMAPPSTSGLTSFLVPTHTIVNPPCLLPYRLQSAASLCIHIPCCRPDWLMPPLATYPSVHLNAPAGHFRPAA